ncbi:MATH domain and coiled-coil domain-containing protein [Drosera capensis]
MLYRFLSHFVAGIRRRSTSSVETMGSSSSKEISKHVKEQGPLHYTLKIESFSLIGALLKASGEDCITSSEFSAGGCKWVLKIHWEELKDDKDNGHISIFLKLMDKLQPGEIVTAMFRFYVQNRIQGNYLVVEDVIGRQFSIDKSEWGISRVLTISEVLDTSNGYILDDCCVVGVEVFPAKREHKSGTLPVLRRNSPCRYTWKVANFSGLPDARLTSPVFTTDGISWSLGIYPKGDNSQVKGENLSIFFRLEDRSVFACGNRIFIKYKLSIKDQLRNNSYQRSEHNKDPPLNAVNHWFDANNTSWGYAKFIPLSDLKSRLNGYLENDELIIEVTFEAMLTITNV